MTMESDETTTYRVTPIVGRPKRYDGYASEYVDVRRIDDVIVVRVPGGFDDEGDGFQRLRDAVQRAFPRRTVLLLSWEIDFARLERVEADDAE